MRQNELTREIEFLNHQKQDWKTAHGIWENIRGLTIGTTTKASAYLGTDQNDITSGTATKVQLDTESYDPGSHFDPTTNYRFTVPEAGYYQIIGCIAYKNIVADKQYGCFIRKNGSNIFQPLLHSSHNAFLMVTATDIQYLAKDDYIELFCYHNAGVNTVDIASGSHRTYLSIHILSK